MIANKTTTVPAAKTVADIQSILVANKAKRVMVDYEGIQPDRISFMLALPSGDVSFRLECNWKGTLLALKRERLATRFCTEEHARNVAWRVVRDWLRAQLSLIEAGVHRIEQVMLPWALCPDGTTVADKLLSGSAPLLLVQKPPVQPLT